MAEQSEKPVRDCTACGTPLTLSQIVYSSDYPNEVLTRTGTMRKGTLRDAARVWCSVSRAKLSYHQRFA